MDFDVCCILLYSIQNDARTLNIARTLHRQGKRVAIIALASEHTVEVLQSEGLTIFAIQGSTIGRFIWRWFLFAIQILPLVFKVRARSYWASDAYVLPFVVVFSLMYRAQALYDSREIYTALGALSKRPFAQSVISTMERYCIRNIDTIVSSGSLDSKYLMNYYHLPYVPPVILNVPPLHTIKASSKLHDYFSLSPQTRIIVYQGMIFYGRGLLPVVRAMPFVDDCVFVVIGEGDYQREVEAEASRCGVANIVLFTGKVDYDELPSWTISANLGLSLIEPVSLSYNLALPNKLFEYCMAGIPSLASNLPAMREIVERHDIGIVVEPDCSPETLARHIRYCLTPEMQQHFASQCLKASKILNWSAQEQLVVNLFSNKQG